MEEDCLRVSLLISCNVLHSVLIILVNKWIFTRYGFPNVTLTCLHLLMTTFCILVYERFGSFHRKSLPVMDALRLSLTFCAFVVFTNLSLQTNTVGTYLVFKMTIAPAVVAIETFWLCRKFSRDIILTLIPVMMGILLYICMDAKITLLGTVFGISSVSFMSIYLVMLSVKSESLQINSLQLLFYQAPLSVTFLLLIIPVVEPVTSEHGLFAEWSFETMVMMMVVLLSSIAASTLNLSMFFIGNLSPLVYNVVGYVKFCLTLLGGAVVFDDRLSRVQIIGIALACCGLVAFTTVRARKEPSFHSAS